MAHNLTIIDGKADMAFVGDRKNIWHRLGTEMPAGASIAEWAKAAGLEWEAVTVPAYADLTVLGKGQVLVPNAKHVVRNDNGFELGYVTDVWKPVQPREVLAYFEQYISVDENFKLDVAGSLKGGRIIWATATYNSNMTVGGDQHKARLLMTTSYDTTRATINKATMTRVVCNNTLDAAMAGKGGTVATRHSSKFEQRKVSEELADVVKSIHAYKAMGDAMALVHLSADQINAFFKSCLDIKEGDETSTRKTNQLHELESAYNTTTNETEANTAWCALNAVTRFVDHSRGVRDTGNGEDEARFLSSQFGSGATMKAKAVKNLYEMFGVKVEETVT